MIVFAVEVDNRMVHIIDNVFVALNQLVCTGKAHNGEAGFQHFIKLFYIKRKYFLEQVCNVNLTKLEVEDEPSI